MRLNQLVQSPPQNFAYEYDFGDGWEHRISVEKMELAQSGIRYPTCLTGRRNCPPEDVGGPWGYQDFLAALSDPQHSEHQTLVEWIGGEFDSEHFNLGEVNRMLEGEFPVRKRK